MSRPPAALPTRHDFRFFHRLRVRWVEIDMQKIVFNGHYLMYFDTAIADYWRALALPYEEVTGRFGGDMFVKKATLEYHASAHYDDLLEIGIRCTRIGTSSLSFATAIFCQNAVLITGEVVYVFADPASQKSKAVPPELRELFEAYERGEPALQVRVGNWDEMQRDAQPLRRAVFCEEQGIAPELEWDAMDAQSLHAVAYNRYGLPLGTGRLLPDGHIGRMAVIKPMRGSRVGTALLEELVDEARRRGHREAVLHAQSYVAPFYRRHGFVPRGAQFEEAGIAHIEMFRPL